jgi:hypothetical protein
LVSIVGIGEGPDAFSVTDSKVSIGELMSSVLDPNFQIESYHHWLPSVTKCPRLDSFKKKSQQLTLPGLTTEVIRLELKHLTFMEPGFYHFYEQFAEK